MAMAVQQHHQQQQQQQPQQQQHSELEAQPRHHLSLGADAPLVASPAATNYQQQDQRRLAAALLPAYDEQQQQQVGDNYYYHQQQDYHDHHQQYHHQQHQHHHHNQQQQQYHQQYPYEQCQYPAAAVAAVAAAELVNQGGQQYPASYYPFVQAAHQSFSDNQQQQSSSNYVAAAAAAVAIYAPVSQHEADGQTTTSSYLPPAHHQGDNQGQQSGECQSLDGTTRGHKERKATDGRRLATTTTNNLTELGAKSSNCSPGHSPVVDENQFKERVATRLIGGLNRRRKRRHHELGGSGDSHQLVDAFAGEEDEEVEEASECDEGRTGARIDRPSAGGLSGPGNSDLLQATLLAASADDNNDPNRTRLRTDYGQQPATTATTTTDQLPFNQHHYDNEPHLATYRGDTQSPSALSQLGQNNATITPTATASTINNSSSSSSSTNTTGKHSNGANSSNSNNEYSQLRILEMRKEKSRDAARSRRSKENHEFYELAKLLPLPAAITSQLDFLDKASIIRLTISFLKLRQFSVNGNPPWAPDFTTLGSINPYSSQALGTYPEHYTSPCGQDKKESPGGVAVYSDGPNQDHRQQQSSLSNQTRLNSSASSTSNAPNNSSASPSASSAFLQTGGVQYHQQLVQYHHHQHSHHPSFVDTSSHVPLSTITGASLFDIHQGTHILQSLDGFAFAIGRDGRFLYISETVSMYLGLSQVEMTGSSVFDYTHQQDHEELAKQLGIPFAVECDSREAFQAANNESPPPASVHSQYSVASNETLIDDYVNNTNCSTKKRAKTGSGAPRGAYGRATAKNKIRSTAAMGSINAKNIKIEACNVINNNSKDNSSSNADGGGDDINHQLNQSTKDKTGIISGSGNGTAEDPLVRQFCIRMKSTLTKRGCQHFKSSGYRVVHIVAHLRSYQSNDHGHLMDPLDESGSTATIGSNKSNQQKQRRAANSKQTLLNNNKLSSLATDKESNGSKGASEYDNNNATSNNHLASTYPTGKQQRIIGMVAVAIALPPPSINELRLESDTFVLRLGPDLRITHIEPKITEILHYPIELVAGKSLYTLVHPADVEQLRSCHKDLLRKGQMMSGYYRLLARSGGYIWIQTCATLICNNTIGAGQPTALSSSPMLMVTTPSIPSSHHQHQHNQGELHHLSAKLPTYLTTPTTSIPTTPTTMDQYNNVAAYSKIMSPGMSSHLSGSHYQDHQDQDQCIIFVNHMITNIVESNQILDICQSAQYTPLGSFSGGNNSQYQATQPNLQRGATGSGAGVLLYNSPSSSCSSPCIGLLKPNNSHNNNNNHDVCSGYTTASSTPNESIASVNLTAASPTNNHRIRHQSSEGKSKLHGGLNGRRGGGTGSHNNKKSHYLNITHDENGLDNHVGQLAQLESSNHYDVTASMGVASDTTNNTTSITTSASLTANSIYSNYPHAHSSVNLALNNKDASWLGHHHQHHHHNQHQNQTNQNQHHQQLQQQQHHQSMGRYNDTTASGYGGVGSGGSMGQTTTTGDHYNKSIYKAAFGLATSEGVTTGGVQYNQQQQHHHHQAHHHQATSTFVYSAAGAGSAAAAVAAAASGYVPQPVASSTAAPNSSAWDTVAAVAAASSLAVNHHHHTNSAAIPYTAHHLESHAHHHQSAHNLASSAAAAAAAAAASSNHTSGSAYYNYYGYYGNKFI